MRNLFFLSVMLFLATGCGSEGSEGSEVVTPATVPNDDPSSEASDPSSNMPVAPPTTQDEIPEVVSSTTLLERLQTVPLATPENIYYWACDASRRNSIIAYLFGTPGAGESGATIGAWGSEVNISNGTFRNSENFTVIGSTDDSLLINYQSLGVQEDITSIAFVTSLNWTGFSTTEGNLNCMLIESARSSNALAIGGFSGRNSHASKKLIY